MIFVTKPFLPDISKYQKYLERIYESRWLTNNGPLVKELNARLCDYLGVSNLVLVNNGTMALTLAYRLLGLNKSAITTPFTFVATTSSLCWHNIRPKFSDIDANTFNINPALLGEAVDDEVEAIIPVHVFGNACDIGNIEKIAAKNNLKTIYDASHAFGVSYKDKSILSYGDVSTLSFHATKLFHTIEGGALVINNDELYEKAVRMVDFGYDDDNSIAEIGTNAKMSEFHAAMGLAVLDDIDGIIGRRKEISDYYEAELSTRYRLQEKNPESSMNYSYFPVVFESEQELLDAMDRLNSNRIYPRRYFYPSLDTIEYTNSNKCMAISRAIADKIFCLPLYDDIGMDNARSIVEILKDNNL